MAILEVDGVSRRFRGLVAVDGLSFTVEPGQTVAIIGPTGAGKSTVINLIPRFYDVTGGHVLVDGLDVRHATLASLRGQIAIVLQETTLFSGTIRENIAYGRPDATDAEIEAAAHAAQAHTFISQLPDGYATVVGTILLRSLEEYLRVTPPWKDGYQAVYGAILIVSVLFLPRGIIGLIQSAVRGKAWRSSK